MTDDNTSRFKNTVDTPEPPQQEQIISQKKGDNGEPESEKIASQTPNEPLQKEFAEEEAKLHEKAGIQKESSPKESESKELEKKGDDLVVTTQEKNLSALGYISFLCVLPLCRQQDSKFCTFHGKQGMIITIIFFILNWLGEFSWVLWFLLFLLHIGLMVLGIYHSIQGKIYRIPFIADVADKMDI